MYYKEFELRGDGTSKVHAYVLDPEISFKKYKKRPAIVICPGGAYLTLAAKEGESVAARFLGMGYNVFLLKYITYFRERPETVDSEPKLNLNSHFPEQLIDLMTTMKLIHDNAETWGVDSNRVYTLGFSAGAHLVGTLAEYWDKEEYLSQIENAKPEMMKPRGVLMAYPMINTHYMINRNETEIPPQMKPTYKYLKGAFFGNKELSESDISKTDLVLNARIDMPRIFVWHSLEDAVVKPLDTIRFVKRLCELKVKHEFHLFQTGAHGMSLCDETTAVTKDDISITNAKWIELGKLWLDADEVREKENYYD